MPGFYVKKFPILNPTCLLISSRYVKCILEHENVIIVNSGVFAKQHVSMHRAERELASGQF